MDQEKFNEIIDFAILREKEAVEFYRGLKNHSSFNAKIKLLDDFEKFEESHINILEKIRKSGPEKIQLEDVQDLKISDYLVEKAPHPSMTPQDILVVAIKREEKSQQLYQELAKKSQDETAQKIFTKLANEESQHKLEFEKMYDDEFLSNNY